MDLKYLKFIVFIIDEKFKEHSGYVFSNLKDAKEYVNEVINESYKHKAVIGSFYMDLSIEMSIISSVQTFNFKRDRVPSNQQILF